MNELRSPTRKRTPAAAVAVWTMRALLAALLILVVVAAMILLLQPKLDLTPYRGAIAQYLSTATDREVRLDGELHVTFGRRVHVTLSDLSLANPAWAESADLFRAAEASAGLDLFSLVSGVIRLDGIALSDSEAALEVSADGARSWVSGAPDASSARTGSAWRLVVEDAHLQNVSIRYRDPASAAPFEVTVSSLEQKNDAGMLALDGSATANGLAVSLRGLVGPLESLIAGRDIDIDLHADLDKTAISVRGHLGDPQRLEDIEGEASVRGPNLGILLAALGIDYPPDNDIDLTLKVMDREQGFALESNGHLGHLDLNIQGEVAKPLELNDLRLSVHASGADLAVVGRLFGVQSLPAQDYRLQGDITRDGNGLELRDVQLQTGNATLMLSGRLPQFPKYDQANARLEIEVPKPERYAGALGTHMDGLGSLRASATLEPRGGSRPLLDASADWGKNRLTLKGLLGESRDLHGSRFEFEWSGASLAALGSAVGRPGLLDKAYRLAGKLTVDESARLRLDLDQGRIGDLSLAVNGFLGRLPHLSDADISGSLSGPSLQQAVGLSALPAQAFEVKTRVTGNLRSPVIDKVNASLSGANLEMSGKIVMAPMLAGTDARFSAQIPKLDDLIPASSGSHWSLNSYRLTGRLVSAKEMLKFDDVKIESEALQLRLGGKLRPTDKGFKVSDLRAELFEGEITAELGVELRDRPYVDLIATAHRLDLRHLVADRKLPDEPPSEAASSPRVIPDSPLPLGFLDRVEGRFRLTGESLVYLDPVFQNKSLVSGMYLDVNLERGGLVLRELSLSGDRGAVRINGALTPAAQGVTAKVDLKASKLRYGMISRGEALEDLPKHELDVQLTAHGRTYTELAASLNGAALMTGGSGRLLNASLERMMGSFLSELLASVNPFTKREPFTQVVCSAALLDANDGIVRLAPGLVIRTNRLDIATAGSVDLNTERIDLQFRNTPRQDAGLSMGGLVQSFVRVGGTLAKPELVLNSQDALISGTAAVATGGLSILALNLFDRAMSVASNPCEGIVKAATEGAEGSPRIDWRKALRQIRKKEPPAVTSPVFEAGKP